ncbi:hypothetical protein D2908_07565 [Streptococcus sp. LQJ-218]|nr:hypothetical protein D2908_07565 [Streptococcus sp. LQJ-218]
MKENEPTAINQNPVPSKPPPLFYLSSFYSKRMGVTSKMVKNFSKEILLDFPFIVPPLHHSRQIKLRLH